MIKTYSLAELDNVLWTHELFGHFVQFNLHDMGQFMSRMEDSDEHRGRLVYRGNGKNVGVYLELMQSGKITDIKCDTLPE
jgi:hypothetical protein